MQENTISNAKTYQKKASVYMQGYGKREKEGQAHSVVGVIEVKLGFGI